METNKSVKRLTDEELDDILSKPSDFFGTVDANVFTELGNTILKTLPPYEKALFFSIASTCLSETAPEGFKKCTKEMFYLALNEIDVSFLESNAHSHTNIYKDWMKSLYKSHLITIVPNKQEDIL